MKNLLARLVKLFCPSLLLTLALACGHGCIRQPGLAEGPITPEQRDWVESLQRWHPGWEKPYVSPVRVTPVRQKRTRRSLERDIQEFPEYTAEPEEHGVDEIILVPVDDTEDSQEPRRYTVEKGDTLSRIALQFYGDSSEWKRIWKANTDILEAPDQLRPGMVLDIPTAQ